MKELMITNSTPQEEASRRLVVDEDIRSRMKAVGKLSEDLITEIKYTGEVDERGLPSGKGVLKGVRRASLRTAGEVIANFSFIQKGDFKEGILHIGDVVSQLVSVNENGRTILIRPEKSDIVHIFGELDRDGKEYNSTRIIYSMSADNPVMKKHRYEKGGLFIVGEKPITSYDIVIPRFAKDVIKFGNMNPQKRDFKDDKGKKTIVTANRVIGEDLDYSCVVFFNDKNQTPSVVTRIYTDQNPHLSLSAFTSFKDGLPRLSVDDCRIISLVSGREGYNVQSVLSLNNTIRRRDILPKSSKDYLPSLRLLQRVEQDFFAENGRHLFSDAEIAFLSSETAEPKTEHVDPVLSLKVDKDPQGALGLEQEESSVREELLESERRWFEEMQEWRLRQFRKRNKESEQEERIRKELRSFEDKEYTGIMSNFADEIRRIKTEEVEQRVKEKKEYELFLKQRQLELTGIEREERRGRRLITEGEEGEYRETVNMEIREIQKIEELMMQQESEIREFLRLQELQKEMEERAQQEKLEFSAEEQKIRKMMEELKKLHISVRAIEKWGMPRIEKGRIIVLSKDRELKGIFVDENHLRKSQEEGEVAVEDSDTVLKEEQAVAHVERFRARLTEWYEKEGKEKYEKLCQELKDLGVSGDEVEDSLGSSTNSEISTATENTGLSSGSSSSPASFKLSATAQPYQPPASILPVTANQHKISETSREQ